eukprot:6041886-Pyramimonas_sp.AAC.1
MDGSATWRVIGGVVSVPRGPRRSPDEQRWSDARQAVEMQTVAESEIVDHCPFLHPACPLFVSPSHPVVCGATRVRIGA